MLFVRDKQIEQPPKQFLHDVINTTTSKKRRNCFGASTYLHGARLFTQEILHNREASKEYYQKKRDEGKSHLHAIKCLVGQLVQVIYAMLRDRTYYQPNKNIEQNEKRKKEVAAELA